MRNNISGLLELSRINLVDAVSESVDAGELIEAIASDLQQDLEAQGVALHTQPGMPKLHVNKTQMSRVFQNLLTNALKYGCTSPKPKITVGWETAEREVRFSVTDNGPGIAPEFHEKAFGLFQRLDTKKEGTGVGLAIVKRTMDIYGGRVWIESEPGHGTTFWVAMPKTSLSSKTPLTVEPDAIGG